MRLLNKLGYTSTLYPEIYLPIDLYTCADSLPRMQKPCMPSSPVKPAEPRPPKRPITEFNWKIVAEIIVFVLLIVFFFIIPIHKDSNKAIPAFVMGCFYVFIDLSLLCLSLSFVFDKYRTYKKRYKQYLCRLKNYPKEMEQYKRQLEQYYTEINNYPQKLQKYKDNIAELNTKENIAKHRKQLFSQKFRNVLGNFSSIPDNNIKTGISENNFFCFLKKAFAGTNTLLQRNMTIKADNDTSYYPDILLSIGNNIVIDIEIDEPYDFTSKKPIHYSTSSHNASRDDERNAFFLQKNCCIIRFSEQQVCDMPMKCFRVINDIINQIKSLDNIPTYTPSFIKSSYPRFAHTKWDESESSKLASIDYRFTYLCEPSPLYGDNASMLIPQNIEPSEEVVLSEEYAAMFD